MRTITHRYSQFFSVKRISPLDQSEVIPRSNSRQINASTNAVGVQHPGSPVPLAA
jgi:hypothetical protein